MTKPRLRVFATLAGVALLLLGVLYGMTAFTVHAPPPTLAGLQLENQPRPVPDVAFSGPDGRIASLRDFKGRYVLVNLWAPWCAPCAKELPALARLQRAIAAERLVVVAVDVGREGLGEAQDFLAAHHAGALPVYVDGNAALLTALGGNNLPLSVLIGPDGHEIARTEGPCDWSAPDSVAYLQALVERI